MVREGRAICKRALMISRRLRSSGGSLSGARLASVRLIRDRKHRRTNGRTRYKHTSSQGTSATYLGRTSTHIAKSSRRAFVKSLFHLQRSRALRFCAKRVLKFSHAGRPVAASTSVLKGSATKAYIEPSFSPRGRQALYHRWLSTPHHTLSNSRLLSIGCCFLLHPITHSLTHCYFLLARSCSRLVSPILSLCSYVSGVCITLGV